MSSTSIADQVFDDDIVFLNIIANALSTGWKDWIEANLITKREEFEAVFPTVAEIHEVKTLAPEPPSKDDAKQLRVDIAVLVRIWRACGKWSEGLLDRVAKEKLPSGDNDLDDPISASCREDLYKSFVSTTGLVVPVHMCPSDTLLGRLFRECRANLMTLFDISKVKSLSQERSSAGRKKIATLEGGIELHLPHATILADRSSSSNLSNVNIALPQIEVLKNGLAISGMFPVKNNMGVQVTWHSYSASVGYLSFIRQQVERGATADTVVSTDLAIRTRQMELFRNEHYVSGEALSLATKELHYLWAIAEEVRTMRSLMQRSTAVKPHPTGKKTPGGPSGPTPADPNSNRSKKRALASGKKDSPPGKDKKPKSGRIIKTAKEMYDGKLICKKFNDARGCANQHVCDALLSTGKACASKDHVRTACPHKEYLS